jgi:ribonuclease-3
MPAPVEEIIGHSFVNGELLEEALTHKSHAFERGGGRHNERLEFLGDSVLAAVVAHHLFTEHPQEDEGRLSKMKAALVSRAALGKSAENLKLGIYMRLGQGEESTGGRERPSILSNALEAVIGAVYLDGGYKNAEQFIYRCILDKRDSFVETDYKSCLQEIVQKRHKVPPSYELLETAGPDHDKTFTVRVSLGSRRLGTGTGKTKKEAEQAAAHAAMKRMEKRRSS